MEAGIRYFKLLHSLNAQTQTDVCPRLMERLYG